MQVLPQVQPQVQAQQLQAQTQETRGDVEQVLMQGKMREQGAYDDIEKKRMKYINKLSLAERLGLVEKPPQPRSYTEWQLIE